MDLRTGDLVEADNLNEAIEEIGHKDVEMLEAALTKKQEKLKKISLKDNKSKAGKELQAKRKAKGITR